MDCLFFYFESLLRLSNNGKNVKIAETVAIAVTKHPAKFGIKNWKEEKVMTVFISPGPRFFVLTSNLKTAKCECL